MKLGRKQEIFSQRFALLVLYANHLPGYTARIDAVKRSVYESTRLGMPSSLHTMKLAGDLLLFLGGIWIKDTAHYKMLGDFWKSFTGDYAGVRLEFCWGGDFKKPDGNHFSIRHGRRK